MSVSKVETEESLIAKNLKKNILSTYLLEKYVTIQLDIRPESTTNITLVSLVNSTLFGYVIFKP